MVRRDGVRAVQGRTRSVRAGWCRVVPGGSGGSGRSVVRGWCGSRRCSGGRVRAAYAVATFVTLSSSTLTPPTVRVGVWLPKDVAVTTPVRLVPDASV